MLMQQFSNEGFGLNASEENKPMVNLSIQLNVSAGNWTEEPDLDVNQAVVLGLTLALFILFAIVGNIMVILSVACNRQLQTVTNYFIINLAVADLLLASIVLPFSATLEVLDYWCFGRIFCDIWAAVDVLCCTASIMSLCIISIDRYIGVRYSLRYPTIMTEKKAVWILIVLWLSSMVISIGPLLGWKEPAPDDETVCSITEEPGYALFSSLLSFYLPLMVILVMYFRIYVVARRTTKSLEAGVKKERSKTMKVVLRIHCKSAIDEPKNKGQQFRSSLSMRLLKFSREKKAAKTLGIVVGVFILCWLPFFIVLPLGTYITMLSRWGPVIFWLGYFNSCINPIIYPCSSKEFKRAFIRLLKCQCRRRRRPVWRVYDHHWRSSIYSSERGSEGDIMSQAGVSHEMLSMNNSFIFNHEHQAVVGGGNESTDTNGTSAIGIPGSWKLFSSLRKSQLGFMSSLSNKLRTGPRHACPSRRADGNATVESISISVCQEQAGYQIYEEKDCFGLKETDI
uniref:Adrenoceptor alpha 1D n=1 Tax=Callorhinchus milii TaxID=7868 RepID=A0A4W3IGE2_CALMI